MSFSKRQLTSKHSFSTSILSEFNLRQTPKTFMANRTPTNSKILGKLLEATDKQTEEKVQATERIFDPQPAQERNNELDWEKTYHPWQRDKQTRRGPVASIATSSSVLPKDSPVAAAASVSNITTTFTSSKVGKYKKRIPQKGIRTPNPFDILMGKGKNIQNFTGNARLRHLVDMYLQKYNRSDRKQKVEIIDMVKNAIYESNARFLQDAGNGCWDEVSDDDARIKVSKLFRARRQSAVVARERRGSNSS